MHNFSILYQVGETLTASFETQVLQAYVWKGYCPTNYL